MIFESKKMIFDSNGMIFLKSYEEVGYLCKVCDSSLRIDKSNKHKKGWIVYCSCGREISYKRCIYSQSVYV